MLALVFFCAFAGLATVLYLPVWLYQEHRDARLERHWQRYRRWYEPQHGDIFAAYQSMKTQDEVWQEFNS